MTTITLPIQSLRFQQPFLQALHAGVTLETAVDKILHPDELRQYESFQHLKKRQEFVAGRYHAKQALNVYLEKSIPLHSIKMDHTILGAPFFVAYQVQVSLSHCDEFCLAWVSDRKFPIGIDCENIHRVQQIGEFFEQNEREQFPQEMTDEFIDCCLWVAKEAVAKLLQTGLSISMNSLAIERVEVEELITIYFTHLPLVHVKLFWEEQIIFGFAYLGELIHVNTMHRNLMQIKKSMKTNK